MTPDVSICIPTYRSAAFIARTLDCARAQTHEAVRIVVSVDPAGDDTAAVCARHAEADRRIDLVVQERRLGWSANANAALDRAGTEYAFIYFHDDIIEPTYVERLVGALGARPDAVSAHCDLIDFGLIDRRKPAHAYEGRPARRIIDFLMTQRGTTLRSMIRERETGGTIRFPRVGGDRHWAAYVFHLRLVAAGPALAVDEPLYRRWHRPDSMTRQGWQAADLLEAIAGQRDAVAICREIIDAAAATEQERSAALHCLRLFCLRFVEENRQRLGASLPDGIPGLDDALPPPSPLPPGAVDAEAAGWIDAFRTRLERIERPALSSERT